MFLPKVMTGRVSTFIKILTSSSLMIDDVPFSEESDDEFLTGKKA
jgi:hypothetical protein